MRNNVKALAQRETGRNLRDSSSRISKLETVQYPYAGLAGDESIAGVKTFTGTRTTLGRLNLAGASATIAAGVITATTSFMVVDTEGAAATDDLVTINGGAGGDILVLATVSAARDVTVKNGTGNIFIGADRLLSSNSDTLTLIYHAGLSRWLMVGGFGDNV